MSDYPEPRLAPRPEADYGDEDKRESVRADVLRIFPRADLTSPVVEAMVQAWATKPPSPWRP